MDVIGWMALGFLAGAVAKAVLAGEEGGGFLLGTWLAAILGAVLILVAWRSLWERRTA